MADRAAPATSTASARRSRPRPTSRSGSRRSSRSSTPGRSSSSTASRSSATPRSPTTCSPPRPRRADRHGDRDPLGPGGDLRRGGRAPARAPRAACSGWPQSMALALASAGTHPWANYLDQKIIDTEHYNRLRDDLRWVAQRNNTWSLHVHVGVQGADRAIAVTDRLRGLLPDPARSLGELPVPRRPRHRAAHGPDRDLHPHVPALRDPEPFGDWAEYADFVSLLTGSARSSRRPSSGGASGPTTRSAPSRCGSATPRPRAASPRRSRG